VRGEKHIVASRTVAPLTSTGIAWSEFLGDRMAVNVIAMKRDVDHAAAARPEAGRRAGGRDDAAVGDTRRTGGLAAWHRVMGRSQSLDRPLDSFRANAFRWGTSIRCDAGGRTGKEKAGFRRPSSPAL